MTTKWMNVAIEEIGVEEIPGPKHSPRVLEYHKAVGLKATDDETPWCAAFTGWVYKQAGIVVPQPIWARGAAARTWLGFGKKLDKPIPGALMVLRRGSPTSGHTTFFVEDIDGVRFKGLGGNQSNKVGIDTYKYADVLPDGIRWPEEIPIPTAKQKLRNSGVMRWAGAGLASTAALFAENGQYIVSQLFEAEGQFRAGTAISAIAGVVIILALTGVIYSRVKGAKDERKIAGDA